MPRHLLLITTAALMLTGAAWAQANDGASADRRAASATDSARVLADRVIGLPVLTEDGEQVGDVADLIVDQDRRVRGVVVAVGGFLGLGVKEVGVAWDKAEVRSMPPSGDVLILRGLTSDDIETAPSLETEAADSAPQELDARAAGQAPSAPVGAPAQ